MSTLGRQADTAWDRTRTIQAEWPEPTSLPEGLSPVQQFDFAILPESVEPWVMDIPERMQCPPDYVAVAAMVSLGAVLGRKIGIKPQQKTDWFEVANLWGCIVGRPGSMKSPALDEALGPLHRLEMEAREAGEVDLAEYERAVRDFKIRQDAADAAWRAKLKNSPGAARPESGLAEPEPPAERRYITNDTTYEKLGEIHMQTPNGLLAHRDELVSLLKTLDREDNAAARGFYLTAWGGKTPYKFDRITRGKCHIDAACISVLGSTQPGRLAEYVRRAVSGGAADDGLIQRFGLLVWPDELLTWRNVDFWDDGVASQNARNTFDSFDRLSPDHVGAQIEGFEKVPCLRFDQEGGDIFLGWREELEGHLRSGTLHPALESHLAKYRKLVPALALITHLAEGGTGPVGERPVLKAIGWSAYLETHAKRAYASGPEYETAAAKAILSRIRAKQLEDGFTARDVHRPRWSRLTDHDQVQAGLNLLCDLDWLAAQSIATAGRSKTAYRINPRGGGQ